MAIIQTPLPLRFETLSKIMYVLTSLIFIAVVLYFAARDVNAATSNTYFYVLVLTLPFVIAFMIALRKGPVGTPGFLRAFGIGAVVAAFFGLFCYMLYTSSILTNQTVYMMGWVGNLFLGFIVVLALAILFNVFSNYFLRIGGAPGVMIRLLFFVPCLVMDFIRLLNQEFMTASRMTTVLLAIETVLVGVYVSSFYWPAGFLAGSNIILQKDPIFLNTGVGVPIASASRVQTTKQFGILGEDTPSWRKTYSISFWLILNAQDFSQLQQETVIFSYENTATNPKPRLTFGYDASSGQYVYRVYACSPSQEPYRLTLPYQRWNYWVFTYRDGNIMDLFLNGQLHTSMTLPTAPSYSSDDVFTVGQHKSPLNGAISNILYHPTPMTDLIVANRYNLRSPLVDTSLSPLVN